MAREFFPVEVHGLENHARARRQIIFHGMNKTGSLALTKVLMEAYYKANRANQFMTTYYEVPRNLTRLRQVIGSSSGHSFFMAHYLYGSYRVRPQRQVLLTQFRNPVPRARSCHQWVKERKGVTATFEEWLIETQGLRHSQMEQFAIGWAPDRPPKDSMGGEEMFDRAVANIERDVAWFGLAERFEETIFAVAAMCGLKKVPPWRKDERNKNRPLVTDWAPGEEELVREVYAWDLRLYEWATARFEQNLAQLKFGPSLGDYRLSCRGEYKDRLDVTGDVVREDLPVVTVPSSSSAEEQPQRPAAERLRAPFRLRRR